MFDIIALWLGRIILLGLGLIFIGILFWLAYLLWDYYLKKIVGWSDKGVRKDLIYFARNSKEIRDYIKNKQQLTNSEGKA